MGDQEKKEKDKQDQEKNEKQDKGTKEKVKKDEKDKRDKKVKNARGKIASANVLGLQVDKAKLEKGAQTVEKETKERKERKQAKTGPKNMEDNMKKHEEARKEAANRERERKDMHGEDLRQRLHLILTKEATCLAKEEAIQAEVKKQQEAREAEATKEGEGKDMPADDSQQRPQGIEESVAA